MKGVIAVFCCVLLFNANLTAQPICGFDESHHALQIANPAYKSRLTFNEQKIASVIQQRKAAKDYQKRQTAIFIIPIVVHVLHTGQPVGTAFNPGEEQIIAAVNYLNAIYGGTHPSLTPAGPNAAGDLGLRFVLAQRDPDCNPTNGIHRVDMSANASYAATGASSSNVSEDMLMKEPVAWDQSRYYNIYMVNKINGQDGTLGQFVAGYAYFPTSSIVDGTVMLATQMKAGSKTLSHEIGHAFNLYHPFEGSVNRDKCPVGKGDFVNDTDPVFLNASTLGEVDFTCRTGNNTCINLPYSIRTESNFMSYSNCYTLFTPGQKDRMQASLTLEERSSFITSMGTVPTYTAPVCVPKINFEQNTVELPNAASIVDGCRKYEDHVFNFTIGSNPVQSASATIRVDPVSTARESVDFDFPTGKNVLFPLGIHNKQSFILRVYGNSSSLQAKQLRLQFSVENGGGIVQKGTAVTEMNITIKTQDYSPVIPGTPANSAIGTQSYDINNARVFDASLQKQRTQIIYKASELISAGFSDGSITGIRFFIKKYSGRAFKNMNIKLAQTTINNLVEDGHVYVVDNTTTVFSQTSYTTVDGWNSFTFNQPFIWNGTDNLAVEMCFDNGTAAITDKADLLYAYSDGGTGVQANMIENKDINCSENFSSVSYYLKGVKPVIVLDYVMRGNPPANTISTSKEEYLGPYSEVYFYDALQPQKIIAKIKNRSDWDYGCTTISIDREGKGTAPFWNNLPAQYLTRKSFFVRPQNNNPSGSYEITFYYTHDEKLGYESATGNTWGTVKMVKTKASVGSVSPADPESNKTEVNDLVMHDSFGEDHLVQATFNTGFSGFAMGIINTVLPVNWLDFKALYTNGNVKLSWSTAMEFNNNYFEIEMSKDGLPFIAIDKVASKGSSNSPAFYEFLQLQPQPGKMYYRIKQVDFDGRNSYSKIIELNIDKAGNTTPWLYPVPTGDNLTIHFGKPVSPATIEILSSEMKYVYRQKINSAVIYKNIYTGNWASGIYFIRLTAGKNSYVLRFVKY